MTDGGGVRYFMPNAWADWVPTVEAMADFVGAWKSRGLNGCGLQIPWDAVEPRPGQFVWEWLDERLDLIADAGLAVHLRLATHNHRPEWVDAQLMRDPAGNVVGGAGWSMLSFADPKTAHLVSRAMGAIAQHVQEKYEGAPFNPVVCILPQFSGPAETEYASNTWSDFSEAAQEDFRRWLRGRFASIDELNECWGTRYGDWSQVRLQSAHVWDFTCYRTRALAGVIDACAEAVHAAGMKMAVQFGSIWDGISVLRGTRDARALIENVDWVVIDDYPLYDHAMSMDYLRGHARDKMWGNEVDGPGIVPDDVGLEQCLTSLKHGAKFLWAANWPADAIRDRKWTFWEKVMVVMGVPYEEVRPDRAIVVSLATACRQEPGQGVDGLFCELYRKLSRDGSQPVDIITDTVILNHPEWLAGYEGGLYIPASEVWMTNALFNALQAAPVPVYAESAEVGSLDEYGRPRAAESLAWKVMR